MQNGFLAFPTWTVLDASLEPKLSLRSHMQSLSTFLALIAQLDENL